MGTDGNNFKSKQSTLVPAKGIRGGRYVENEAMHRQGEWMENIPSPNRVPWCRLLGFGVGCALRMNYVQRQGERMENILIKSKQSTLVPTTGIQVGGTLRMNYVQRQGERMENI